MKQLDTDLIENITARIKEHVFKKYNMIPIDRGQITEALDDGFVSSVEDEIKHYYDGLFDESEVHVNISKQEYAELI